MPRYSNYRPVETPNIFGSFLAGQEARQKNTLAEMDLQKRQNLNALSQDPNATPEQYVRAGDVQTGSALQGMQQNSQAQQQAALDHMGQLAQRAKTITDPAQRRQFLIQAAQVYAPHLTALGGDPQKSVQELQQLSDQELDQRIDQMSQYASPEKPVNVAAGGSLVSPSTGKPLYTAPENEPSGVQEYKYAQSQGYKGTLQQWKNEGQQAGGYNQQLITRPVDSGKVQDYLVDPRTGNRVPNGAPYDPGAMRTPGSLRPVPSAAAQGIIGNRTNIRQIDRAMAAVDKNPDAFGTKNYAPDALTQRIPGNAYSGGVSTRALIADIGSLKIHDRSGAAVTASETPRLKPFIPSVTDTPQAIRDKLTNFKATYEAMNEEAESFYSEDAGYRPMGGGAPKAPSAPAAGGWTVKKVK